MPGKTQFTQRRGERGQTIVLVAISIVSLLAMAALAIDVVTLYVARSEIQRAADAAALAGAKAMADSGVTGLPITDSNFTQAEALAQSMAKYAIDAVITTNLVAGSAPSLVGNPSFNFVATNNPHVTVALTQANLPTFFARIFGRTGASVTASATAEAYSPANSSPFTPIAPRCVKPFLVANADPRHSGAPFISSAGGVAPNVVGELPFYLTANCAGGSKCNPNAAGPWYAPSTPPFLPPFEVEYVPALVTPNVNNVCPSCLGPKDYERSIECCDVNSYAYLNCGGGAVNAQWDNNVIPQGAGTETKNGALCLIHALNPGGPGSNSGQDVLDESLWPASGPMKITAGSGPQSGNLVATSSSIVSIPIFDQTTFIVAPPSVTIVGYLQAFINYVSDGSDGSNVGDVNISVINIVGCSASNNGATPIVGGDGTSPVPVRLIKQ